MTEFQRFQLEEARRDRFESAVMTAIVLGFLFAAWWVS
jgi:hypothetical protein